MILKPTVGKTPTILSLVLAFALASIAHAQLPFQESFEAAPGTSYTLAAAFDDGGFDYFGQYAVPDTMNGARDDFANGWDGGFGIHSQDNDGATGPATVDVAISGIDISNHINLVATIGLAALASEAGGFDNYEAEDGDGIAIFATLDGGTAMEIGRFSPPAAGANGGTAAGDLYLDPDGDGVGTGTALSADLADFAFPISGTGSSLDLSIALTSTGSFEPLALDNVRVSGEMVPEPNALLLSAFGLLGLLSARRRR